MDKYQIKALALSLITATHFALPIAVLDHQIPEPQEGVVNL